MKTLKLINKKIKLLGKNIQCEFTYTETIHTFTSNGSITIPENCVKFDYLIVAGGGGSGAALSISGAITASGGAGAGGLLSGTTTSPVAGTYDVVIGAGGNAGLTGAYPMPEAGNGGNSSFYGLTAIGGGKSGGAYYYDATHIGAQNGGNGGSSGAGGSTNSSPSYHGNYGTATEGQGFTASSGAYSYTGFGGGSKSAGVILQYSRWAGSGTTSNISGSEVTYAKGGSGVFIGLTGNDFVGAAGENNTGNGASGSFAGGLSVSNRANGSKGGSGIVIVKIYT